MQMGVCVQIRGLIFEAGFLTFEEEAVEETEEELPPPEKPAISWWVCATCLTRSSSPPLRFAGLLRHGFPLARPRRCFRCGAVHDSGLPSGWVRYLFASGRMHAAT
jgi:hypothetical protein